LIGKALREPLLHFLLIGIGLFAVFQLTNDSPPSIKQDAIVIGQAEADALAETFRRTWRRPPNESEMANLLEDQVREEVFVREALALGLDKDDAVVRRRLRQKMEFLTSSIVGAIEPDDAVVQAFYESERQQFERAGQVAFEQVFLGEAPAEADIARGLEFLRAGGDPGKIGKRSLIPPDLPLSPENSVDGTFGRGFFQRLNDVPENVWSGPVLSGYGTHLVLVTQRQEPMLPPLDTIRDKVLQAWRAKAQKELLENQYQNLKARYDVSVPVGPANETGAQ
jgi:hypothetical protein